MPTFHCNCGKNEFCGACSKFGFKAPNKTIVKKFRKSIHVDWEFLGGVLIITGFFLIQFSAALLQSCNQ